MDQTANRIREQAEQVKEVYDSGKRAASDLMNTASEQSKKALTITDQWVHENPWMALGVVAGVGCLLGLLIAQGIERD